MNFEGSIKKKHNNNLISLLSFVLIIIFSLVSTLHAATYNYYFSNSGGGSTCSVDRPCANVSDAKHKVDAAASLDTVNLYFKRGDSWTFKTAAVSKTNTHGLLVDTSNPVVNIDAYGSGNKPCFDGLIKNFSTVPMHNPNIGPLLWSRIFEFRRPNCSVKNVEIRRVYGNGILLKGNGENGFYLKHCNINNFGGCGITVDNGANNITVEHCTFHTGQQLIRYNKRKGWGGAINLKREGGIKPSGVVVRYNLVYDIAGEGINAANAIIEYNIIGDTSSIGICTVPHNWDYKQNIIRYNLIIGSDWTLSDYDNIKGVVSSPVGWRMFDEQEGGSNRNCDVQFYGNIIINRSYGVWLFNKLDSPFGSIKIYNNTIIDCYKRNIYVNNPDQFLDVKFYNNASFLYDRSNGVHAKDYNNFLPYPGWDIDNNFFWTSNGTTVVGNAWKRNAVIKDPKLPGNRWTRQSGANYYYGISIADIYPPSDSAVISTGKNLGSGYNTSLLTYGTNFSTLPDKAIFQMKNNSINSKWTIGAIINGGETPTSLTKPENLRVISVE